MHRIQLAAVVSALAVVAISCADSVTPPDASRPLLAKGGAAKVAICHAAGRADDPKFVPIEVSENAVSAHMGTQGTEQAGHEVDYFITARTPCPPPATPGIVRICKAVLPGIAAGTPFTFVVSGRNIPTQTVTVAAGSCVDLPYRVGTTVNIRENVPTNTVLAGVTLTPGTGTVTGGTVSAISGTNVAQATYTNRSTVAGLLTVCKVAGSGVAAGTPFDFTIGGTAVTIPAGAGPGGGCVSSIRLAAAGPVSVVEGQSFLTTLSSITVSPSNLGSVSLPNRSASATIVPGVETRVTFTNTNP
jgi:hypothetical protein